MDVPIFPDLDAALRFLVTALDSGDYDLIADACSDQAFDSAWQDFCAQRGFPSPREYRLGAIRALAECHQRTPLLRLYAGRSFPEVARKYKLGGHDKELGYLHVDFARDERGWALKELWICR